MNMPIIPTVPDMGADIFFADESVWEEIEAASDSRKEAIAKAVETYTCLRFVHPRDESQFITVTPSLKGYRYQATKWDSLGPVWDAQRDSSLAIAKEIPSNYVLTEVFNF